MLIKVFVKNYWNIYCQLIVLSEVNFDVVFAVNFDVIFDVNFVVKFDVNFGVIFAVNFVEDSSKTKTKRSSLFFQ